MGVPFEPQICHEWFRASMHDPSCWPRFLYGPDEGNLDHEELSEMVSILRPFTGWQECFIRFAEIPLIGTDKPILFGGELWKSGKSGTDGTFPVCCGSLNKVYHLLDTVFDRAAR